MALRGRKLVSTALRMVYTIVHLARNSCSRFILDNSVLCSTWKFVSAFITFYIQKYIKFQSGEQDYIDFMV